MHSPSFLAQLLFSFSVSFLKYPPKHLHTYIHTYIHTQVEVQGCPHPCKYILWLHGALRQCQTKVTRPKKRPPPPVPPLPTPPGPAAAAPTASAAAGAATKTSTPPLSAAPDASASSAAAETNPIPKTQEELGAFVTGACNILVEFVLLRDALCVCACPLAPRPSLSWHIYACRANTHASACHAYIYTCLFV